MRRDLTRTRGHTKAELDAMARITPSDTAHAAATYRADAPVWAKRLLDLPEYTGSGVPSDATRDP